MNIEQGWAAHAVIGKLIVQLSELSILWGLDEPGALLRFSDVSKLLFDASKSLAANMAAIDKATKDAK